MQPDPLLTTLYQTFAELGASEPESFYQTLLLRDRQFVGHCYHCGDLYALWAPGSVVIEFYRRGGELLRTVPVDHPGRQAVA